MGVSPRCAGKDGPISGQPFLADLVASLGICNDHMYMHNLQPEMPIGEQGMFVDAFYIRYTVQQTGGPYGGPCTSRTAVNYEFYTKHTHHLARGLASL